MAWRVAIPSRWTLFAEGASVARDVDSFREWHRTVGVESRRAFPPVPVAFAPGLQWRAGVAYSFDSPFDKRVRAYLVMRLEP